MSGENDNINVTITGSVAGVVAAMHEASTVVKEATEQISLSFEAMAAAVETALAPLLIITAVLEGGEMFKETIEKTANLAVQLEVLSQKTGATVEELSRLKYAADIAHVSAEELSIGLQRLARGMEQAEKGTGPAAEAFKALRINVVDATGHLRPMTDVLTQVADRFAGMKDGAGKTALAMDLFGRSGANLIPLLNQGKAGIEELEAAADKLGITMSGADVSAAVAYEEAMKNLHGALEGTERQLAIGLMPALSGLAAAFTESATHGEAFRQVGEFLGETLRLVAMTGRLTYLALQDIYYITLAIGAASAKDFGSAAMYLVKMQTAAEDAKVWIDKLWSSIAEKPKPTEGGAEPPALVDKGQQMRDLEAGWLRIKEANKENFGGLEALELEYWRSKLAIVEKGSQEYLTISKRISELDVQVAKAGFEGKIEAIRAREALDAADKAQVLADREEELTEIRKHYAEASKEVQAGVARVNQARQSLVEETAKDWSKAFDAIPKAFNDAVGQIGKRVTDMRSLFREVFRDLAITFAQANASMLANHVATELAKRNISLQSVEERIAAESWAAIKSVALTAWSALQNIGAYAAQAAAAAWAAMSAVPFIGPVLGPAAAAAALAGVMALAGSIHSAHDGFDVGNSNPLTQLHAQEMVLPAELANKVRGMTEGGGGGGGGDTHIHIHTMDAQGVKQFVTQYHRELAQGVKMSVKNGTLTAKDMHRG